MLLKFLTVTALASVEIYAAIPAGFAFELAPWIIFIATVTGGLTGVYVTAFLGHHTRKIIARYRKPRSEKPKTGLVYRIWEKYGIIGLGLLGTLTVGAPISITVGLGFKAPLKKLVVWCCTGVILRCGLFTGITYYGLGLL